MNRQPRLWHIGIVLLALGALTILAAGVRSVDPAHTPSLTQPGRPAAPEGADAAPLISLPTSPPPDFGWPQILVLVIFVLGVALYARRSPRRFLVLLLLFLAVNAFFYWRRPEVADWLALEGENPGVAGEAGAGAALEVLDVVSAESPILTLLASLALGVALTAAVVFAYRRWRVGSTPVPLAQLALNTDSAIADIRAGGDLANVVLRCYADMTNTLARWRGISRPGGMTPREFAQALADVGLPRRSVERLTILFENVRYGAMAPAKRDELEAVSCLSEISDAIRGQLRPAPG